MRKSTKNGFTLIELLVVIAIIAILAAVITPSAFKAIEKSKVSKTLSDMKAMRTAVLQFYSDVGFFPADAPQNVDPGLGVKPTIINNSDFRNSISGMGITPEMYNDNITKFWSSPYLDNRLNKPTSWAGVYDYECWWPGRSAYPEGIWITIHGIPEKSANILVQNCPFTVRSGDPTNDDLTINGKRLKKVSLKIADWQN